MALSKIKFFSEMSKTTSQEEMLMLYKELSFIQLPARRTLFNIGDIGRNFYIILSGSVWVSPLLTLGPGRQVRPGRWNVCPEVAL